MSMGLYQSVFRRIRMLSQDNSAITTLRKMGCKWVRAGHKQKTEVIPGIAFVFNLHQSSTDRLKLYKYLYYKGTFVESFDLVRQRSFNNSLIRLTDGSVGLVKAICHKEGVGWRLTVSPVVSGYLRGLRSVHLDEIQNIAIGTTVLEGISRVRFLKIHDLPKYFKLFL